MKQKWPRSLRISPWGKMRWSAGERGFTLIEALVALSISAMAFSAATLVFQSIGANNKRLASVVAVTFPNVDALQNFYNLPQTSINVYSAPNYGKLAPAEELRERFWEDIDRASAVYCLGRNRLNTVRPLTVDYPGVTMLDTPEAFRQHLELVEAGASLVFDVPYNNVAETTSSGTVYMFRQSNDETLLNILAIYEIDLIVPSSPAGTYVSVRRYAPDLAAATPVMELTNYYDCFFEQTNNEVLFRPIFVNFERRGRLSVTEDDDNAAERNWADRFKRAENMPFYFMWWPDPSASSMRVSHLPATPLPAADPRSEYVWMGGRTSFMFVLPMFPAL